MPTAVANLGEHRFLLHGVPWQIYEGLLASWTDHRTRMTYDRGNLEFMSPLHSHEQYAVLIGQLIELYTMETNTRRHTGGSTTFKREAQQRGLEPDRCYWIQNEAAMRGRKDFDSETDPPPDLAIEVDITRSSLNRMSIYASLGVPEVWRFDGETLTVHLLQSDGASYRIAERSVALAELPPDELVRFVRRSDEQDEITMLCEFRDWIRSQK